MKTILVLVGLALAGCSVNGHSGFGNIWSDDPVVRRCARQSVSDAHIGVLIPGVQYGFYRACLHDASKAEQQKKKEAEQQKKEQDAAPTETML